MNLLLSLLLLSAPASGPTLVNVADAKWVHEKDGSESVTIREDDTGYEIMVRYPAGHTFAPHWHSVNERILMVEGKLAIGKGADARKLDPGGYAFLPAKEVQNLSCVSASRCTFYILWDGKLDFHRAQ